MTETPDGLDSSLSVTQELINYDYIQLHNC